MLPSISGIIHPQSGAASGAGEWEGCTKPLPGQAQLLGAARGSRLLSGAELLLLALLSTFQRIPQPRAPGLGREQPWNKLNLFSSQESTQPELVHSLSLRSFSSCWWGQPWLGGWWERHSRAPARPPIPPCHPKTSRHFHQIHPQPTAERCCRWSSASRGSKERILEVSDISVQEIRDSLTAVWEELLKKNNCKQAQRGKQRFLFHLGNYTFITFF